MKKLVCLLVMVAMVAVAQANLISDPGFEAMEPGIVPDWGDWASWNGNFDVGGAQVHTGLQSVLVGAKDLPNSTGDKYSNLRNYINPETLDNTTWTASFWIYYDSTQEGNGAETDTIELKLKSADNWNTAVVENLLVLNGSDFVDATWTYVELALDIPVQGLDPADPEYNNKVRNRVGVEISQNGWIGHTGDFYVDDVTMTQVPEPATMALLGIGGLLLRRRK